MTTRHGRRRRQRRNKRRRRYTSCVERCCPTGADLIERMRFAYIARISYGLDHIARRIANVQFTGLTPRYSSGSREASAPP